MKRASEVRATLRITLSVTLLALVLLAFAGCGTPDYPRPWNEPQTWNNSPLPSQLNAGR